ncbi:Aste57867_24019 [Aphanomyces stellatus]|uniref:Aste57867_24019 protein n=1 Tax=Aphanomyces stellatus TaxID=120398 RepID=A0A485LPC8_9STRA|nr:hypothetical protein As57867_023946 [Aphanomyces stellatus]VFU00662.1 Aste57867_24019 [Aphanomyces stellatus]
MDVVVEALLTPDLLPLVAAFQDGTYEDAHLFCSFTRRRALPAQLDVFNSTAILHEFNHLLSLWGQAHKVDFASDSALPPRLLQLCRCVPALPRYLVLHATFFGHMKILVHLHKTIGPLQGTFPHDNLLDVAAFHGQLETLVYLDSLGHPGCTTRAMDVAAQANHMDIVAFLDTHRTEGGTEWAMNGAAYHGHLDMVEWLHTHRSEGCTSSAMDCAAQFNHLGIVKFLHSHRTEGCTTKAMDYAAANGHLKVVQFLHDHRTEGATHQAMEWAAKNNHATVVRFLHRHREEGSITVALKVAAAHGHVQVVNYLLAHAQVACGRMHMEAAAANGHLDMVKFLLPKCKGECTTRAMDKAAANGHLEVVQFLDRGHRGCLSDRPRSRLLTDRLLVDAKGHVVCETSNAAKLADVRGHGHVATYLKFTAPRTIEMDDRICIVM